MLIKIIYALVVTVTVLWLSDWIDRNYEPVRRCRFYWVADHRRAGSTDLSVHLARVSGVLDPLL